MRMQSRIVQRIVTKYPGVYRAGPRSAEATFWAAVLACGDDAVISGRAGA